VIPLATYSEDGFIQQIEGDWFEIFRADPNEFSFESARYKRNVVS
jgi:hypothetical protein